MARLTYANGVNVEVADDVADDLLSRGYSAPSTAAATPTEDKPKRGPGRPRKADSE